LNISALFSFLISIQVFDSTGEPSGTYKKYLDIYKRGIDTSDSANATMHEAMTDLAFIMANRVWNEVETEEGVTKGRLFFAIGGVNDVNPFSGKAVKNEVYVYTSGENKSNDKPLLTAEDIRVHGHIEPTEGNVYSSDGSKVDLDLAAYGAVYMDFNGSMALFSSAWERNLDKLATEKKLKGVFVMGGVLAEAAPLTMPSIPGVLNRFSSATMNQLYHPARTASFFDLLARHPEVPVFTVTNNAVGDLLTMNSSKEKTMEGVWAFMDSNGLMGDFLRLVAKAHYESRYSPPRKAYDFYTSLALCRLLTAQAKGDKATVAALTATRTEEGGKGPEGGAGAGGAAAPPAGPVPAEDRYLFYSGTYGMSLVSSSPNWKDALCNYVVKIDTDVVPTDPPFIRTKKETFLAEIAIMHKLESLPSIKVRDLRFDSDNDTRRLSLAGLPY